MHDFHCAQWEGYEAASAIIDEARSGSQKEKEKLIDGKLAPLYESVRGTAGWFADFQKNLVHRAYAKYRKGENEDSTYQDIRRAYLTALHSAGRDFEVPAETLKLKESLLTSPIDVNSLPKYSCLLQFTFTLARPWISKDDTPFSLDENQVRKDKVFKIPVVESSTWKGNLRWAATRLFVESLPEKIADHELNEFLKNRNRLTCLFGSEKESAKDKAIENEEEDLNTYLDSILRERLPVSGESPPDLQARLAAIWESQYGTQRLEQGHRRGALYFFPTFFDRIGLEVFNPHKREGRIGKGPIYFESVPAKTKGELRLLYLPFHLIGCNATDEIAAELHWLLQSVKSMFLTWGFSAKKSLDYGIAYEEATGTLDMAHVPLLKRAAPTGGGKQGWGTLAEKLASLNLAQSDRDFNTFDGLLELYNRLAEEVRKSGR